MNEWLIVVPIKGRKWVESILSRRGVQVIGDWMENSACWAYRVMGLNEPIGIEIMVREKMGFCEVTEL